MKAQGRGRLAGLATHKTLLVNAGSLVSSLGVSAGLGFVYWWVAARYFAKPEVGLASALIAAMNLLGAFGIVGLGTLLMGKLARQTERRGTLVVTALLTAAFVSALLGAGFVWLAPRFSHEFAVLQTRSDLALSFIFGVAITGITLVLDQAVLGLLRGGLQFWRNVIFAVVKLVLVGIVGLWWSGGKDSAAIYNTWTLGNVISLLGFALLAWRSGLRLHTWRPQISLLRELPGEALRHHMLNLALQTNALLLPVIVTAMLSANTNASFAVAWLLASFVSTIPFSLGMALYAVGSRQGQQDLGQKIRLSLRVSTAIAVVANIVLWVGADFIIGIFGPAYREQAPWALRLLTLAVFPIIVKDHFIAIRRVSGRVAQTAGMAAIGGILELSGAVIGASVGGLYGLCIGRIIGFCLEAMLMGREVFETAFPRSAPAMPMTQAEGLG